MLSAEEIEMGIRNIMIASLFVAAVFFANHFYSNHSPGNDDLSRRKVSRSIEDGGDEVRTNLMSAKNKDTSF